jgi:hypothetical protein
MAGELLQLELRRMDAAYVEQNKREYEITKHVSLAEVAPEELMKLRDGLPASVELPEKLFEQDWPGHYLRRIKSVSVTVPVTNAPYGSVSCKLSLAQNKIRKAPGTGSGDENFYTDYHRTEAIVTSSGQNDGGLFELIFRDERYLPFEGAGALSTWDISLKKEGNRFDATTIHDVVLHVRYTAREAGNNTIAAPTGVTGSRLFSAKTDFPAEWYAFVEGTGAPAVHELEMPIVLRHFQPLVGKMPTKITSFQLYARRSSGGVDPISLHVKKPTETSAAEHPLGVVPNAPNTTQTIMTETATGSQDINLLPETPNSLARWRITTTEAQNLEDIWMSCTYE